MISIRNTSPGRVVVESDGCSDYYGGALVQGATICRISTPVELVEQFRLPEGGFDLRSFLSRVDTEPVRGVRMLERRTVS